MAQPARLTILTIMAVVFVCALLFSLGRSLGIMAPVIFLFTFLPAVVIRWQHARGRSAALPLVVLGTLASFVFLVVAHFQSVYGVWVASGRRGRLMWLSQLSGRDLLLFAVIALGFGLLMGAMGRLGDRRYARLRAAAPCGSEVQKVQARE